MSANVTIPSPAGGTNTNRPTIIAAVVLKPSFELPGPVKCFIQESSNKMGSKQMSIYGYERGAILTVDEIPTKCQQDAWYHGVPKVFKSYISVLIRRR